MLLILISYAWKNKHTPPRSLWAWTSFHDIPVSCSFRIWRMISDSALGFCCRLVVTAFVCLDLRTDRSNLRLESYRVEESRHQNGWPAEVIWCCLLIDLYKTKTDMFKTNHNGMLHLFWMLRLRESKGGTMQTFENQVRMGAFPYVSICRVGRCCDALPPSWSCRLSSCICGWMAGVFRQPDPTGRLFFWSPLCVSLHY